MSGSGDTAIVAASNVALAHIGARSISGMQENSVEARSCLRLFSSIRDRTLSMRDWRFATARSLLAPSGGDAPFPWQYQYLQPAQCIKPRAVTVTTSGSNDMANDDRVPFEEGVADIAGVLTQIINTSVTPAALEYTYQIVDPSLWDLGFMSAFALQLAAEIAIPITGNGKLAQAMRQAAAAAMDMMQPDGKNEGVSQQQRGADSIYARGG